MIALEGVSKVCRSFTSRTGVGARSDSSLQVWAGEVVGIAGPNGAGKFSMISLLLGFLEPTAGRVRIDWLASRPMVSGGQA